MPLFNEVVVDSSHQTVSALPRPPDVAGTRPVDVALADQTLKAQRFARELRREGLADDAVASVAADDRPWLTHRSRRSQPLSTLSTTRHDVRARPKRFPARARPVAEKSVD